MGLNVEVIGNMEDASSNYGPVLSSTNQNRIIQHLKSGNTAIIYVLNKFGSEFAYTQHYMALLDINENGTKIFVSNPSGTGRKTGWIETTRLFNGAVGAQLISK